MPTTANLNLYTGWNSCVGWHRDDEPLFGKCGDARLIVSVSLGNFALFRWRRQSCPADEGRSCQLGHGDILVMVGQCQDEFLHRTDPGREQDRINITFRWVKHCPFLKAGVACCLPTCAEGSSVPVTGNLGSGGFWAFMFRFVALCILGVLALLVYTQLCTGLGSRWCASCWTRPLGEGRWEHYLRDFWRESMAAHNTAAHFYSFCFFRSGDVFRYGKPYMLALAGQPSLHGYDACMVLLE